MVLILHIGTRKAGSTTIQKWLVKNEKNLPFDQIDAFGKRGNAWKIAAISGTEQSKHYWVDHRRRLSEEQYASLRGNFWDDISREFNKKSRGVVVASSKYIYDHFDNYESIYYLHDNLKRIFSEIRVIIYLRNQVDFIKSSYAQIIKGTLKCEKSFNQYFFDINWDKYGVLYDKRLRLWESIFENDSINVGLFDKRVF